MTTRPNPYVGPRAFDVGTPLYGRARELRKLKSLLVAERIVLLHSPSGAGKTSLIQAGLIPILPKSFNVLPIVRVNLEPPTEVRELDSFNRYIFSTLVALEENQPVEQRLPIVDLATLGLDAYIEQRLPPGDMVLIFDQFEEILTVAPSEREAKAAFFAELGLALRNPDHWALFALREDFIGALDPYLRSIPGQMECRYRLDLLKFDAAREAIQSPAREQGVTFSVEAAAKLIYDLSRIQTQDTQGATHEEQGEYVEPVQLQVVCYNLWQNLPDDTTEINEADLAEVGSVDESLAGYYAGIVVNVAAVTNTSERDLRNWFDNHLLTGPADQLVRGQVRKGQKRTEGLVNTALDELIDTHIIRAEPRAGAIWYELAHDRLIEPIHKSNSAWFYEKLTIFQRRAWVWHEDGRPQSLLLTGKKLEEAEQEAKSLSLISVEREFLKNCRVLERREQRERRNNRIRNILFFFAIVATIFAVIFAINANSATQNANRQARLARARELAAQSQLLNINDGKQMIQAGLLAVESARDDRVIQTDQTLRRYLDLAALPVAEMIHADSVKSVIFSPDSKYIAAGGRDNKVTLWNIQTSSEVVHMIHDGGISSIAFSPNGKYIVSSSYDKTVRVWDIQNGHEISRMTHDGYVNSAVFSPDGKYVLSGSEDKTARVWDVQTGREIARMTHDNSVYSVAFSSNGMYVASGSGSYLDHDNTARVWEAHTGHEVARMTHNKQVSSIAFSPDGKYLVSGSLDKIVRLWDVQTGREVARMTHDNQISSVAFSPNGKYIVSSSYDKTARVWDAQTGREIARMTHDDLVNAVTFSPDSKYVISGSEDNTARVWDAQSGHEIARMTHDEPVYSVAFSLNGEYVVSSGRDGIVQVWQAQNGHEAVHIPYPDHIISTTFTSDGRYIIFVSSNKNAVVWDVQNGYEMAHIDYDGKIYSAVSSPNGKYIAFKNGDNTIGVWNVQTGHKISHMTHDEMVFSIAFSPDSKYIVSGSMDKTARIWDVQTGYEMVRMVHNGWVDFSIFSLDGKYIITGSNNSLPLSGNSAVWVWDAQSGREVVHILHDSYVRSIALSPDGKYIASGSGAGVARVWETLTGREIAHVYHHNLSKYIDSLFWGVGTIAFSPDGKYIVSGGWDNTALVWDARTGHEVARMTHDRSVSSVVFSADGRYVVSSSYDKTMRVWDIQTRREVARMIHDGSVYSAEFSLDGKYIFSNSYNNVQVWYWRIEDLIAEACRRLPRNFTRAEWAQYFPDEAYRATCPNLPIESEPTAVPTP